MSVFFFVCRAHNFVALKVVKSAADYTESALDEIRMLKSVSNTKAMNDSIKENVKEE